MKKLLLIAIAVLLSPVAVLAAGHSVVLVWTPPADATASSKVAVFRADGACSANPSFTSLATGIAMTTGSGSTGTYTDTTVSVGTYCYTVQHVLNGANSANSNLAPATVSPLPITTLTVTVN